MTKVNGFKEIFPYFKKQHNKYANKISKNGGYIHLLQAFTAQVLWILLIYVIYIRIIPIKDNLSSSALFLLLIGLKQLIDQIASDIIPEYIENILKGRFFYDFDSGLLLKLIVGLLLVNYFLLLVPLNIVQKIKKELNYGK